MGERIHLLQSMALHCVRCFREDGLGEGELGKIAMNGKNGKINLQTRNCYESINFGCK